MATQLELSEKSTKLLEEIKKLSKQANKLTGATTGRGLTQFKFFVFLHMYRDVRISSYCSEDKFINRLNKLFRAPCTPFLIRKKNMLY